MMISPFPPRELAKLVLGYLAEEQLMTAYDEFLQGSPYLDAQENEHDRVFMTPLRNIVAEYRALKIYVETCKPFKLRRRLMGCANLLEAVKLLVHLVDTGRITGPDQASSRISYDNANVKTYSRVRHVCDVCSSLNRSSCACHVLSKSNTSIEATLLEDLPGHHGRKKHVKVLDNKEKTASMSSNELLQLSTINLEESSSGGLVEDVVLVDSQTLRQGCNVEGQNHNSHSVREASNTNQRSDALHTALGTASNQSQYKSCMASGRTDLHSPAAGSFQDFAAGVEGKNTVPDSSTSECLNSVIPVTNEEIIIKEASESGTVNKKGGTKAHILLKVEGHKNSTPCPAGTESPHPKQVHTLRPKPSEQKITILSDIKVDKGFPGAESAPAVLRHVATPRVLRSVLINDTRVFTTAPGGGGGGGGYSRDEIMAMPTIILVPAQNAQTAGQSYKSTNFFVQPSDSETNTAPSTISSTARSLAPILIDVDSSSAAAQSKLHSSAGEAGKELDITQKTTDDGKFLVSKKCVTTKSKVIESRNEDEASTSKKCDKTKTKVTESRNESEALTVKTCECRNATVPKDAEASTKSTPVSVPLPRKSSSTPRRSSHVRVLDFATPRRIIGETIPEHPAPPIDPTASNQPHVELVLSKSPSLHTLANLPDTSNSDKNTASKSDNVSKSDECAIASQSIQKIITVKKSDWDADLRALAVANAKMDTPKPKAKSSRRKKASENKHDEQKSQEKKNSRRKSNVARSTTKIKFKSLEVIEDSVEIIESSPPTVAVKPTINIITEHDWGTIPTSEESNKNKSNNEDETDTPEMERLSLQNAIGAKLNISDLLETPYKQVLYDIQMETPRFLGPDLPGEPLSDIKIMNIPTPRFLATPAPPLATPSYPSRQTDYSSSSSYYKPDDHDCIDIGYPASAPPPEETPPDSKDGSKNKSKEKLFKSSRPVRKCTKNVSYVNSPNIKAKDGDRDDESVNSEAGPSEPKTPKELKSKTPKTDTKRKSVGIKKKKTPVKKETSKSFMKIKPRRPTPVKDSGKKMKQSGTPGRKRTASRDKAVSVTPAVASAPTKSRRKSSTPRKLHCTKQFHSESSGHESPDTVDAKCGPTRASSGSGVAESDAEPPLRWSDDGDGTKDSAPADAPMEPAKPEQNATSYKPRLISVTDTEDITKIQEYLATSEPDKSLKVPEGRENDLHMDLVRRGFDVETAKIIERDLLDTPPYPKENLTVSNEEPSNVEATKDDKVESSIKERGASVSSTSVDIDVVGNGDEEDEVELSVYECNEDSKNYIVCHHGDIKDIPRRAPEKLKEKFSMEVCIDDDVAIRLRANPLTFLIDEEPKDEDRLEYNRETEIAVSSISGMAKLYTPLKDQRAQCYEIFDSTLTSLDTPLKIDTSNKRDPEMTVTEIVLEEEKVDVKDKVKTKRKRALSGDTSDESTGGNKKPKPDPQYLLNPANIKNIDIETVLCKLHGP